MNGPSQVSMCGVEPTYYTTTSVGRMESIDHISWENCIADWTRRYGLSTNPDGSKIVDRHYDLPPVTPYTPPVDDQVQTWLAQHSDLAAAIAVIGVFALAIIVIMLVSRSRTPRANQERKA